MNVELLYHLWPFVIGFTGMTVWLVRLEAKVLANRNETKNLKVDFSDLKINMVQENREIDVKINSMSEKLNEIGWALARIEGFLSKKHE